ncbi:MAG: hypothetical protein IPL79_00825 [Myxococcales bacterium]|nr:hypothetical protein [Myxococcales bacterium]
MNAHLSRSLFSLLACAALGCDGFSPFDRDPGTPPPIGPGGDAGSDGASDGSGDAVPGEATGRLCQLVDMRTPLECASNIDFTGVQVAQIGTDNEATAAADGTFLLQSDPGAFLLLRVGAGSDEFATTIVRLTQGAARIEDVAIPLLTASDADAILANTDVPPVASRGQAVFWFSQDGGGGAAPRSDVQLTPVPSGASATYETLDALTWTTSAGQTGASGVAVALNVTTGSKSFGATYSAQTLSFNQVPIEAGAWTFTTGLFAP